MFNVYNECMHFTGQLWNHNLNAICHENVSIQNKLHALSETNDSI
mgnify:FL=1